MLRHIRMFLVVALTVLLQILQMVTGPAQEIAGLTVTPHSISSVMQWRRPATPELGARVEMFLFNPAQQPVTIRRTDVWRFDGKTPDELVGAAEWAWHETPALWETDVTELPPQSLAVVPFNTRATSWGVGTNHTLQTTEAAAGLSFNLAKPAVWLSAITFLATDSNGRIAPASVTSNRVVVHIENAGEAELTITGLKLWLPRSGGNRRVLFAERVYGADQLTCFSADRRIPAHSSQGFTVDLEPLQRVPVVVEVTLSSSVNADTAASAIRLFGSMKIRPEQFDISGGWIASNVGGRQSLTIDEYLRTLSRMHINAGQIEEVGGYSDQPDIIARHAFKRFNRLGDLERYDRDEMLPSIHAVEFIGEPQYGGGRPVPPQEVHKLLAPYTPSRLHTSVTLSEERTWRYYAGLSDHPHYDAYRVIAPAADAWTRYNRWNGRSIRWGAPLETIGEMTRSLRELSRPRAIACWSQGAHDGWGGFLSPRRGSPTPDELRAQAWHALASRITSLYWFNLSIPSLLKFPDLIEPITRVNREIRMLDELLLYSTAMAHAELRQQDQPNWETSVLAAPRSALLVAHDVAYQPDPEKNLFRFTPREGTFLFPLPRWIGSDAIVFQVDADGVHDVSSTIEDAHVRITDTVNVVGIYIATTDPDLRAALQQRHTELLAREASFNFNPGTSAEDLEQLKAALKKGKE
ncbi:MAG: hypothetical protein ACKO2L_05385 [Planctomycetaceae bacterium]